MKLKTNRMEALTDSIFAIVMTVMLVGLSEIFAFKEGAAGNADFSLLYNNLIADFIVYCASFLILGVLWFEHHWQFHFIKHINPALALINMVWFMFLCLIPLTSMLVGDYPGAFEPLLACELNILIVFFLLHIHWVYATQKMRCVDTELDNAAILCHRRAGSIVLALIICVILASYLHHILK